MTPLERAARALHDATQQQVAIRDPLDVNTVRIYPRERIAWDAMGQPQRDVYFEHVRTVLTAIREPSEAMMDRAAAECESSYVGDVFTAMIDAALAEEG